MAANQAAEVSEDAAVAVVATRTISEGLASLLAFNPEASLEENQAAMSEQNGACYQVVKLRMLFVIQTLMALKSKQTTSWGL